MRRFILSNIFTDSPDNSSHLDDLQQANALEQIAVISREVHPGQAGRAKFQGSWWRVACEQDIYIAPGTRVAVVGRHNITLIVQPLSLKSAYAYIPNA